MEKRGVIDDENTPPEQCCGGNTCSNEKKATDNLEDSVPTRAAKHAEDETK